MISAPPGRFRDRLAPLVYLSNNWLSRIGVVLVNAAVIFWIFLLPSNLSGEVANPYFGILAFLLLPGAFFAGLALIPAGLFLRLRRERRQGVYPANFPPLDLKHAELRKLLSFVGLATIANGVIATQVSYRAVTYMETVSFCGQTCHTVMQPEFAAYQNSPHARVECVKCHIGPGASWFVRSKLSGVGQVFAVMFNTYDRPIPTPVRNLRPARETCETCHWPQKFGSDRLRILTKFADDEANTATRTVLLMHIGGPGNHEAGIHGIHLGQGVTIEYAPADASRQTIPWVSYTDGAGRKTVYEAAEAKPETARRLPRRVMDCVDCHNRPTHTFEMPEAAADRALAAGDIPAALPFARKQSVEILKKPYASRAEAARLIPGTLEQYYQDKHPEVYAQRRAEIARAAQAVLAIYDRNVFPAMKVTWGSYPNNLGHTDFPGCFRCHDDQHSSADGKKITQDCGACHNLLAMDEASPKILNDLSLR
ncbi:MAG TPA: NapC/NirT family cytochrome c [Bryobacterales bacterium]|nr:NapC/NirT family cytochrome c [Bryobacterales bacterium]